MKKIRIGLIVMTIIALACTPAAILLCSSTTDDVVESVATPTYKTVYPVNYTHFVMLGGLDIYTKTNREDVYELNERDGIIYIDSIETISAEYEYTAIRISGFGTIYFNADHTIEFYGA